MPTRIFRILFAIVGAILGVSLVRIILAVTGLSLSSTVLFVLVNVLGGLILAGIFYAVSNTLIDRMQERFIVLEKKLEQMPMSTIIFGTVGVIIGFIIAYLISIPLTKLSLPVVGNTIFVLLSLFIYLGFALLGWRVATRNTDEVLDLFQKAKKDRAEGKTFTKKNQPKVAIPKILDTSVIIDGRILDIIKIDFLEGELIVPEFVLEELQHIADSPDDLKRERGRRGLDIINEIKESPKAILTITDKDYPDIKEVDSKLLKMATDLNAKIFTNDYNLNKVAEVQGITVLNINDLTNALKPIVIPGEFLEVEVIKEGKGREQGVGYLSDGTMVVVEDGVDYIGKTIEATVTSVLQTSAGKMIFVRARMDDDSQ
ncbi:MAG: PIN/TRAM domain-containing protein [Anaerococcus sp.]|nr:PIN/TRAM domain-containing protein [Peptoniphilaceae bacterium]MDY3056096.1 PIN/TRAM domain-containing protein [Anaerococcus sp.]